MNKCGTISSEMLNRLSENFQCSLFTIKYEFKEFHFSVFVSDVSKVAMMLHCNNEKQSLKILLIFFISKIKFSFIGY